MNRHCDIKKVPSFATIVLAPIFFAMLWLAFMFVLQFVVSLPRLNGWLITIGLVVFAALPVLLWNSELRIVVEHEESGYRAFRQMYVFDRKLAERTYSGLEHVYWRKLDYPDSNGIQYHIYGRSASVNDVLIAGGAWLLVSLKKTDVERFHEAFRSLKLPPNNQ